MKKLIVFFIAIVPSTLLAQTDSVILRAMGDELARNMSELHYPGFEDPFYISYSIEDVKQYEIASTLGALLRSSESRNRLKNVRVLVGDYEFNDESLDSESFSAPEANEIQLPLDDDYYGIRRALWVTTDHIYKSAARQYKKNLGTLTEKNKTIAEMPHRRFAKVPAEKITLSRSPFKFDIAAMEGYMRTISAIFSEYPLIDYSTSYLSFSEGHTYFIDSEGTISKTPVGVATLQIFGQRKTAEGETIFDQIFHHGFSPADFPAVAELTRDVKKLCEQLSREPLNVFEDEYSGPVLLVGKPVADMFSRTLFTSRDALIASDALPESRGGFKQDQSSGIDTKLGKSVVSELLTVKARPTLKTYNNVPLIGSYDIDDEGVLPRDVTLIESGILRNLLNDRSLIKPNETANGHSGGPAVIDVSLSQGSSLKSLKEMLRTEAKKENLDYAIVMSSSPDDPVTGLTISKIYVADGKEEMLRGAFLHPVNFKDLKEIVGGTKSQRPFNLQSGAQKGTSYIVPEAILLREAEIRKAEIRIFKEEQYVSNPFKK